MTVFTWCSPQGFSNTHTLLVRSFLPEFLHCVQRKRSLVFALKKKKVFVAVLPSFLHCLGGGSCGGPGLPAASTPIQHRLHKFAGLQHFEPGKVGGIIKMSSFPADQQGPDLFLLVQEVSSHAKAVAQPTPQGWAWGSLHI